MEEKKYEKDWEKLKNITGKIKEEEEKREEEEGQWWYICKRWDLQRKR